MNETAGSGAMAHAFDRATALHAMADGTVAGRTSDDYWNFTGPFGGVTAATLLRAVIEHPHRMGTPLSITVNFCAPVAKGDFGIAVREVRANRSTQHWCMELVQSDVGIAATATAVFAQRRTSWGHQSAQMPAAAAPEGLLSLPTEHMMAWMQHYDFRFASAMPTRLSATPNLRPESARSQV